MDPRETDGGDANGFFVSENQQLMINPDMSREMQESIFWHELIHAFYWAYEWKKQASEERVCRQLSHALVQFLRANPTMPQAFLGSV